MGVVDQLAFKGAEGDCGGVEVLPFFRAVCFCFAPCHKEVCEDVSKGFVEKELSLLLREDASCNNTLVKTSLILRGFCGETFLDVFSEIV